MNLSPETQENPLKMGLKPIFYSKKQKPKNPQKSLGCGDLCSAQARGESMDINSTPNLSPRMGRDRMLLLPLSWLVE